MIDYLGELVAKNFGTAEVIGPRPAARFEPPPTNEFFEERTIPLPPETIGDQKVVPHSPPDHQRKSVKISKNEQEIAVPQISDAQISRALDVRSSPIQNEVVGANNAGSPEAPNADQHELQPVKRTLENRPLPDVEVNLPPNPIENHEGPKNRIEPLEIKTVKMLPPDPGKTVSDAKDRNPENEMSGPVSAPQELAIQNQVIESNSEIVVRPRLEPIRESFRMQPPDQTLIQFPRNVGHISEAAETIERPTINVSIGRVEIRAISPPPTPQETSAKPQTLSLEEYLQKRRTGGER